MKNSQTNTKNDIFNCVCVTASPEWIVRPQDTHIEEGQPGYLHCHAQSTPEPQVTWYRKSIAITDEVSRCDS